MNKPTIAIITRTKNRNNLLVRAMDSVANQTFTDFIHIVVNDGGETKSVNTIVDKYKHNLLVIHNDDSVGLTRALNQGIRSAETKYVAILDDDDTWSDDRIEKAVKFLEESQSVGVVCVTDIVVEELDGAHVSQKSKHRLYPELSAISLYAQCLDNYVTNGCFTYRRSVYDELNGYDENLLVAEDWDFGIRFLLKYDIDYLHTDHALHNYHHRPNTKGDAGNSVFAGIGTHKYQMNLLANHFLRKDVQAGRFGLGYVINQLRYNRDYLIPADEERRLAQTVRLEGHVNLVRDEIAQLAKDFNDHSKAFDEYKKNAPSYRLFRKIKRLIRAQ